MNLPRIYADFNGLANSEVGLEYVGSLRDLSRLRLRLRDGLKLTVYDPSDGDEIMEMDGEAKF